jgi:hypothetical protein
MSKLWTPEKVVRVANSLARKFYRIQGYTVRQGYRFDQATHPQERGCWQMARIALLRLRRTDPDDAVLELDED